MLRILIVGGRGLRPDSSSFIKSNIWLQEKKWLVFSRKIKSICINSQGINKRMMRGGDQHEDDEGRGINKRMMRGAAVYKGLESKELSVQPGPRTAHFTPTLY